MKVTAGIMIHADDLSLLPDELPDAELVFAFVSPLGTPLDPIQDALIDALDDHDYEVDQLVRISANLDDMFPADDPEETADARQERLIDKGNWLRENLAHDYLALAAISAIYTSRQEADGETTPKSRRAAIIRSLKHPDEVTRLRHVYGRGFFLIGVSAPRKLRVDTLVDRNFPKNRAHELLDRDAAEEERSGQQTQKTFHLADAFLHLREAEDPSITQKLKRIVDLLFSCPFLPPTREEHAMFMAYAAAMRSSDLSRQVGAVVANASDDIVASGANDVPAAGGGAHWGRPEPFDEAIENFGPDYAQGFDSNERERNKIVVELLRAVVSEEEVAEAATPEQRAAVVKRYEDRLRKSGLLDLTEFGRAVHAEMAALMTCVRSGVSPRGGTLFCTTFPCHNCAKHIIAAGLEKVVYVEPYPKSKAKALHGEAIHLVDDDDAKPNGDKVVKFQAYEGVAARRFIDLFSLDLGGGRPFRRKSKHADGARVEWKRGRGTSRPRLPLDPRSFLERELAAARLFEREDKTV
ncbi:MAG: anti-phage dCTP deaminase [Myxococcota bacterium]